MKKHLLELCETTTAISVGATENFHRGKVFRCSAYLIPKGRLSQMPLGRQRVYLAMAHRRTGQGNIRTGDKKTKP
jgi:hypothetical protein